MLSIIDTLTKSIFQKATVSSKQQVAPHTFHVRIQGEALKSLNYTAGEHLRLFVGVDRDTALDSKLRTYSVWQYDKDKGIADLAMCTHSSGIGATWIRDVKPGDTIYYMGPKGKLIIDHSGSSYLMVSDGSALSHMYELRRHVQAGKKVLGLTYAASPEEHYADIDGSKPFRFLQAGWEPTDLLIKEIITLKEELSEDTIIYIAGDARVCKSLSRFCRQHWPKATVRSKGFWMPGKTGMD